MGNWKCRFVNGIKIIDDCEGVYFGSVKVLGSRFHDGNQYLCVIECECGSIDTCCYSSLTRKSQQKVSCNACADERIRIAASTHGQSPTGNITPEYAAYCKMKTRCYYEKYDHYEDYGGRGIVVCDRWLGPKGFDNFYADRGPKTSQKHSLDRIDPNGNYTPENTRWATKLEQMNNTRFNIMVECYGRKKSVQQWSEISQVNAKAIYHRIDRGWNPREAVWTPLGMKRKKAYQITGYQESV